MPEEYWGEAAALRKEAKASRPHLGRKQSRDSWSQGCGCVQERRDTSLCGLSTSPRSRGLCLQASHSPCFLQGCHLNSGRFSLALCANRTVSDLTSHFHLCPGEKQSGNLEAHGPSALAFPRMSLSHPERGICAEHSVGTLPCHVPEQGQGVPPSGLASSVSAHSWW